MTDCDECLKLIDKSKPYYKVLTIRHAVEKHPHTSDFCSRPCLRDYYVATTSGKPRLTRVE
jgi:hypothetical protein